MTLFLDRPPPDQHTLDRIGGDWIGCVAVRLRPSSRPWLSVGVDMPVDSHGGDAAGGGDFGHGELARVVHSLGFADQGWRHLRFAATGPPAAAGSDQTSLGAFPDQGGLVVGHQGEHSEDEFAVGGGGVHDPVGQRKHSYAPGFQSGDDVDQVPQVPAEPVDFPDDQGVARPQVLQAAVPLWPVGFCAGGDVLVDLEAAGGPQGVELKLGVLVGGADPGVNPA